MAGAIVDMMLVLVVLLNVNVKLHAGQGFEMAECEGDSVQNVNLLKSLLSVNVTSVVR